MSQAESVKSFIILPVIPHIVFFYAFFYVFSQVKSTRADAPRLQFSKMESMAQHFASSSSFFSVPMPQHVSMDQLHEVVRYFIDSLKQALEPQPRCSVEVSGLLQRQVSRSLPDLSCADFDVVSAPVRLRVGRSAPAALHVHGSPKAPRKFALAPKVLLIQARPPVDWQMPAIPALPALPNGASTLGELSHGLPGNIAKLQSLEPTFLYGYIYFCPPDQIKWACKQDMGLYQALFQTAMTGSIVSQGRTGGNIGIGMKHLRGGGYEIVIKDQYADFRAYADRREIHGVAPHDRYYVIVFNQIGPGRH